MNVSVVSVVDTLTGLAQNLALLLSLTLLYSVIRPYLPRVPRPLRQAAAGVLFALIAIAAMHTPFIIAPGVIADARVIPVLLAGPFGGPGAALTAAVVAAGYRAWLGGLGGAAGVGTILTAGLLGMAVTWWWRRRQPRRPAPAFLLLGVALDAIMLVWAAALPDRDLAQRVLSAAALPVGLFLPCGTLVLGRLLVHESRRHDERERLALTQFAIEHATEALFWIDAEGHIVNVNAAAAGLTGYARDELLTKRVWELEVNGSPERWSRIWAEARAGRRHVDERSYRRPDGSEVPLETSGDFVAYAGREWISVFAPHVTERQRAERARLTLEYAAAEPLPPVTGDVGRLQQIIHNLLSNAIKFTPAGGRVSVRVDRVGDEARLVVSDTGVGIAPAFLPHVFDRFRQADSSMTRVYGGVGLGLTLVRDLVELHRGRVTAESRGDGA